MSHVPVISTRFHNFELIKGSMKFRLPVIPLLFLFVNQVQLKDTESKSSNVETPLAEAKTTTTQHFEDGPTMPGPTGLLTSPSSATDTSNIPSAAKTTSVAKEDGPTLESGAKKLPPTNLESPKSDEIANELADVHKLEAAELGDDDEDNVDQSIESDQATAESTPTINDKQDKELDKTVKEQPNSLDSTQGLVSTNEQLIRRLPFLEHASSIVLKAYQKALQNLKMSKAEAEKQRDKWAEEQTDDIRDAYGKWKNEKEELRKRQIRITEQRLMTVSKPCQGLYAEIKVS